MNNKYAVNRKFKPLVEKYENFYWLTNNYENNLILTLLGFIDKYCIYSKYHYTITKTNLKTKVETVTEKKWNILWTKDKISTEDLSKYKNYVATLKAVKNNNYSKEREKDLKKLIAEQRKYTLISQCKMALRGGNDE